VAAGVRFKNGERQAEPASAPSTLQ
jgi:hypothetical protein